MPVEGYIKKKQTENIVNPQENANRTSEKPVDFLKVKLELVSKVREKIIDKYTTEDMNDPTKYDSITKDALNMIEEEIAGIQGSVFLDSNEKVHILEKLMHNMFGYGVIDPLIKDPTITEIMVNGLDKIFIEKNGKLVIATDENGNNLQFDTPDELMYVVDKIVAPINRKIDDSNPICDARLPNGFRVNIVLNTISLDGTIITIRKFPDKPFTMDRLVGLNSLPPEVADFLEKLVKARYNLFVSGGTGSGKTTFLNALSNFINKDERVITIEDAAELKIQGVKNLIRLETRPPNVEGKGAITMRDLLKSALRMRPDRIVVGEVRTGEALEMLQAMNTGHDGSLSTGHANSAADMLARLETMVMMAGMEIPLISIRQQIATAIEVIVHLGKLRDGTRRVLQITEILGVDPAGNYITSDLFKFDAERNKLLYTGNKLKQTHKLKFAANSNSDGELGKAIIESTFKFPDATTKTGHSVESNLLDKNGLFERFLKTKSSLEHNFKIDAVQPSHYDTSQEHIDKQNPLGTINLVSPLPKPQNSDQTLKPPALQSQHQSQIQPQVSNIQHRPQPKQQPVNTEKVTPMPASIPSARAPQNRIQTARPPSPGKRPQQAQNTGHPIQQQASQPIQNKALQQRQQSQNAHPHHFTKVPFNPQNHSNYEMQTLEEEDFDEPGAFDEMDTFNPYLNTTQPKNNVAISPQIENSSTKKGRRQIPSESTSLELFQMTDDELDDNETEENAATSDTMFNIRKLIQ